MKKIRKGLFETNSSSSHSISISEDTSDYLMDTTMVPDNKGRIVLDGGEFGWGYDEYKDALTKANYLSVYCKYFEDDEIEGKSLVYILNWVIEDQTGAVDVVSNAELDYESLTFSYIDHQSYEDKQLHFLFEDKEKLRQFIFNKESKLIIYNDNH